MITINNEYNVGDRVVAVDNVATSPELVGRRGTVKAWTYREEYSGVGFTPENITYHVLMDNGAMADFDCSAIVLDGIMNAYSAPDQSQDDTDRRWARYAFHFAVDKYVALFANKNGYDFGGWVGDQIGGIAYFGDYCFKFDDIRLDIEACAPKGELLRYTEAYAECNYRAWLKQHRNTKQ